MLELIGAIALMYAVVLTAGIWATRKSRALREAADNDIDSSV
ncbi:MAG: hypothetical protein QF777_09975 [Acidimicrobiales bacterium]|jgi:hypothetical protein|nr:hypothetical protein [Acidimicrobiales bacterium]MDP6159490.1 hypothetical protein [Acidimicrobiales bacterium]MDP6286587.1 hypothetical protein [Acidimicrobiales bacterium]MDP6911875.1 hypothetical protein [Acidimicrobiales bacterium]HJM73141.1 hypothetical protein [Acidimicrobiales bacterium]|tara:strand:- start:387 stop:512 length:126 start_codon:yes stop_codon:yes gene_type:complete